MILVRALPRPASAPHRLLRALERRGWGWGVAGDQATDGDTLLLAPGPGEPAAATLAWLAARSRSDRARLLVLTRLGTHPDARAPDLGDCWRLEEAARASGQPTLTLRLAPLLGPESPLWLRLRAVAGGSRWGERLVNPVAEGDVLETLDRGLSGRAEWGGWFEVAGPEVWSLAELAALARETCGPLPRGAGAWEPPLEEIEEHRLAEAGPWLAHFRLSARPLVEQARAWRTAEEGGTA